MGVSGFQAWLAREYPETYVDVGRLPVDHIYVDMSSIFHPVIRKSRNQEDFIKKLFAKLSYLLKVVEPRKSVILAMDGPAPLAKLLTQRSRREKAARKVHAGGASKKQAISKQGLTPGTTFISDIEEALEFYILQKLSARAWMSVEFELLSSKVEGEGELKIIERLKAKRPCVGPGDTHMVVGGDSDLLLMTLLSCQQNVYVVNDDDALLRTVQGWKGDDIILEASQTRSILRAFSPDALRDTWTTSERSAVLAQSPKAVEQLQLDFATIVTMSRANDYLPFIRHMNGQGSLWDRYLELRRDAAPRGQPLVLDDAASLLRAGGDPWERYEHVLNVNVKLLQHLFPGDEGNVFVGSTKEAMLPDGNVKSYLQGLAWMLTMYTAARCFDYRSIHNTTSPSAYQLQRAILSDPFQELSAVAQRISQDIAGGKAASTVDRGSSGSRRRVHELQLGRPLEPHAFALALLPGLAAPLVPLRIRHLMLPGSPIYDIYRVCPTCTELHAEASQLHKVVAGVKNQIKEKIKTLRQARGPAENATDVNEEDEEADLPPDLLEFRDRMREALRSNEQRTAAHKEAHPPRPFPIARLEQAVLSISRDRYTSREREMVSFGRSYTYFASQHSYGEAVIAAPPPPLKGWDEIKLPRSIRREVVQVGGTRDPGKVPEEVKQTPYRPTRTQQSSKPALRGAQRPLRTHQQQQQRQRLSIQRTAPRVFSRQRVDSSDVQNGALFCMPAKRGHLAPAVPCLMRSSLFGTSVSLTRPTRRPVATPANRRHLGMQQQASRFVRAL
mmetsp:Transcript_22281/g.61820  ORF Transcript_22281/g.61820 Transcript_22281/m.61820 type:complete len:785 (-) Transcript_22281:252-2606(-)